MSSIFHSDTGPCGVFSDTPPCGGGTQYTVSFARAAHLLYGQQAVQDGRGEVVLSYVGIGVETWDLQPEERAVQRGQQGIVIEYGWRGFRASTNVRELDRFILDGVHLEVTQVAPWGDHVEMFAKEVGR